MTPTTYSKVTPWLEDPGNDSDAVAGISKSKRWEETFTQGLEESILVEAFSYPEKDNFIEIGNCCIKNTIKQ